MKGIHITARLVLAAALFSAVLFGVSHTAEAQFLSRGNVFGPGAPPPLAGIELGFGNHSQQGSYNADCGCTFTNGTGTGLVLSLVFELPLSYEWAVGVKGGIDFRNTTSEQGVKDVAVVSAANGTVDTLMSVPINRVGAVKTTYFALTPYLQYQFFRMGPFVQVGPSFGFLVANKFTQTRQLLQTTATINGKDYPNLRFQSNGTTEEVVQDGAITDVNGLRLGLGVSAGYNVSVSERSILTPQLTYDLPLSTIRSTNATDWKIGSLYASAVLKFKLD